MGWFFESNILCVCIPFYSLRQRESGCDWANGIQFLCSLITEFKQINAHKVNQCVQWICRRRRLKHNAIVAPWCCCSRLVHACCQRCWYPLRHCWYYCRCRRWNCSIVWEYPTHKQQRVLDLVATNEWNTIAFGVLIASIRTTALYFSIRCASKCQIKMKMNVYIWHVKWIILYSMLCSLQCAHLLGIAHHLHCNFIQSERKEIAMNDNNNTTTPRTQM